MRMHDQLKNLPYYETFPIFKGLDRSSIEEVVRQGDIKTVEAKCYLQRQGDFSEKVYVLLEGSARTTLCAENGDEVTIRLLRPGDIFMEAVAFMEGPSPINAQVLAKSSLLVLSSKDIVRITSCNAAFAQNLLHVLADHYKNAMIQVEEIVTAPPLKRLGRYLLREYFKSGSKKREFSLPFKKRVISSFLGMKPETFSRSISQLKSRGLSIKGRSIQFSKQFLCPFCNIVTEHDCATAQEDCHRKGIKKNE